RAHLLDVVEPVEVPLAGLLDDVPGRLLLAVVVRRYRPHHLLGELAAVVLPLLLLVGQSKIHVALRCPLLDAIDWSVNGRNPTVWRGSAAPGSIVGGCMARVPLLVAALAALTLAGCSLQSSNGG